MLGEAIKGCSVPRLLIKVAMTRIESVWLGQTFAEFCNCYQGSKVDTDRSIKNFCTSPDGLWEWFGQQCGLYDYRATTDWRDNTEIVSTHYINLRNMSPKTWWRYSGFLPLLHIGVLHMPF